MIFIVGFRNDTIDESAKEAYSSEEIEIPPNYLDDPIGWVASIRAKESIHIVLCVPKEGYQALLASVKERKR